MPRTTSPRRGFVAAAGRPPRPPSASAAARDGSAATPSRPRHTGAFDAFPAARGRWPADDRRSRSGGAGARARPRRADDVRRPRRRRSQRQGDRRVRPARIGGHVRPALKVFQSPRLCAYILHLLPEPRGLVFHLRTVDQIMTAAPAGTDLLMGYPPTRGELRAYLGSAPPRGQRRHRLTLLASSIDILRGDGAAREDDAPAACRSTSGWSSTPAKGAAAFTIRADQCGDQAAAARAPAPPAARGRSATTVTRRPTADRELAPVRRQAGKRVLRGLPRAAACRGRRPVRRRRR